jgi:endonuclease YncB( thermonuclease family)
VRGRSVAAQWATVLVLLMLVAGLQYFKPEWMSVETGKSRDGDYRAIDGDSFEIGKTEIRLHGIDAPEYRQTCKDHSRVQPCGKLAREALSKLIREKQVVCRLIDRDRYGRQVSLCRWDGRDIAEEMVRQGWALAYRKHSLTYVAAERDAKEARRGIWAWEFETPERYRARQRVSQGNVIGEVMKDD